VINILIDFAGCTIYSTIQKRDSVIQH